jgi:hypothetical protein
MPHATGTTGTTGSRGSAVGDANEMRNCIDACLDCHRVCLDTVQNCLVMGGKHAAAEHIRLLLDCAQICQTSADFMIRGSDLHGITCGACAEICEACAEACRSLGGPEMKACVDACDRCAQSCAMMAGSQAAH